MSVSPGAIKLQKAAPEMLMNLNYEKLWRAKKKKKSTKHRAGRQMDRQKQS